MGQVTCREVLQERSQLLRDLRSFFDARGFCEVQTPALSRHAIIDPFIDPIEVVATSGDSENTGNDRLYLQTSPELHMKQMLSQGAPSIYGIVAAFRAGEWGDLHRVEFTMLEWYQVDGGEEEGIDCLGKLACEILEYPRYDILDYRKAFHRYLQIDPINVSLEALSKLVASHDRALAASLAGDRDGLLNFLLSELVQPNLGQSQPLVLRNYPLSQAALAKRSSDDVECAARFELFVQGIELANGYDELRDEKILLKRMHDIQRQRDIQMKKPIPMPTAEVLDSISRKLPQCTGVAMGVDRLHLVRSGKDRLDQVSIT